MLGPLGNLYSHFDQVRLVPSTTVEHDRKDEIQLDTRITTCQDSKRLVGWVLYANVGRPGDHRWDGYFRRADCYRERATIPEPESSFRGSKMR